MLTVFTPDGSEVSDASGNFGKRLRDLRTAARLSLYALSKKSGISAVAISRLEKGQREPAWATAVKLADALCVTLSAFHTRPDVIPLTNPDEPAMGDEKPPK